MTRSDPRSSMDRNNLGGESSLSPPPPPPPPASAASSSSSSAAEQCGFAMHVAVVLVTGWYCLGIVVQWTTAHAWLPKEPGDAVARTSEDPTQSYVGAGGFARWVEVLPSSPPHLSMFWTQFLPTAALGLLVAIPPLYAWWNGRSAARSDILQSVQDGPRGATTCVRLRTTAATTEDDVQIEEYVLREFPTRVTLDDSFYRGNS